MVTCRKVIVEGLMPILRIWQGIAISYIFTIVVLSLIPISAPGAAFFPHFDKIVHLSIHFFLALILANSLLFRAKIWTFEIIFGLLIEIAQIVVPGRSFELLDLLANNLGYALGFLFVKVVLGKGLIAVVAEKSKLRPSDQ